MNRVSPYLRAVSKPQPTALKGDMVQTSFGPAEVREVYWREPEGIWRYRCALYSDQTIVNCGQVVKYG